MRRIVQLMVGVVRDVANRPAGPGFREASRSEITGDPRPRRIAIALRASDSLFPEGFVCRSEDAEPDTPLVVGVVGDSAACAAGLQVGDRICRVQGEELSPQRPLAVALTANAPTVPFVVEREGRLRTLDVQTVAAGASPASIVSLDALFRPAEEGSATSSPIELAAVEEFEGRLDRRWEIENADLSNFSLTERPGTLTVHAQPGSYLQDDASLKNLFLFPNPIAEPADFEATTSLVALPQPGANEQAGLVCFNDADNYAELICEWDASQGCKRLAFRVEHRGRAGRARVCANGPRRRSALVAHCQARQAICLLGQCGRARRLHGAAKRLGKAGRRGGSDSWPASRAAETSTVGTCLVRLLHDSPPAPRRRTRIPVTRRVPSPQLQL